MHALGDDSARLYPDRGFSVVVRKHVLPVGCPPPPKAGALSDNAGQRQQKVVDAEQVGFSEVVLDVLLAWHGFVICVCHLFHTQRVQAIEVRLDRGLSREEKLCIWRGGRVVRRGWCGFSTSFRGGHGKEK